MTLPALAAFDASQGLRPAIVLHEADHAFGALLMKSLILGLAAAAALAAGSSLAADDHAAHHATTAPAQATTVTHEQCKSVMGAQMQGRPAHDHARDKQGIVANPKMQPPSAAEMEKMHQQCAELMAKSEPAPTAK
jgi:hypothetical protein